MNEYLGDSYYKAFLDKTHNGVILQVTDSSYKVVSAGDEFLTTCGFSRQELLERTLDQLPGQLLHPQLSLLLEQATRTNQTVISDRHAFVADRKTKVSYKLEVKPMLVNDGPLFLICTLTDFQRNLINEGVTPETKQNSLLDGLPEADCRNMVMNAHYALMMVTNDNFRVRIANQACLDLWGKSEDEVIQQPLLNFLPELEHQPFMAQLKHVFDNGKSFLARENVCFFQTSSGLQKKFFSFSYDPVVNELGGVDAVVVGAEDITQRVEVRLKTERAEEMLRIAVESANMGTWHFDPQGNRLSVSTRLKELLGYGPEEEMTYTGLIGQVTEEFRYSVLRTIKATVDTGEQFNLEFSFYTHGEKKLRWLRATGKVYRDKQGQPLRLSGIIMEVTEQKQDEIRKNDFISMVSHELKTPLTSLKAYVQLLNLKAKQNGDMYTSKSLMKVEGQVNKMNNMIRSFLDLSRFETGRIFMEKERFAIDLLIDEIVEEILLTDKTHTIIFSACEPLLVHADREKIGQVINNLLSNAVKYSPIDTKILVVCQMEGNAVKISVIDEGVGLAKHDIEKLFDRFYRVENKRVKTVSGFGIGLYLSAEIIKRHHGKIWVESEEWQGAAFHFTLPIATDSTQESQPNVT